MRNLARIGNLEGYFDNNIHAMERASKNCPKVRPYANFRSVLDDERINAVAISTPAATHGELVEAALKADKHVFVEKPLCLDLDHGKLLRALAAKKHLTLMVGHLLHYNPAFIRLKAEVQAGAVGNLRYLYSNRLSLGKIRTKESALWSFAPHDIAMLLSLAGRMPLQVSAHGEAWLNPPIADTTISHFTFDKSLQAHVFVSWLHPYKEQRLVVVGSEGMIVFNDAVLGEDKLRMYPHAIKFENSIPIIEKANGISLDYDDTEPLYNECKHFVDCVRRNDVPYSDVNEGLRVLSVLDACQRSLVSGRFAEPEGVK